MGAPCRRVRNIVTARVYGMEDATLQSDLAQFGIHPSVGTQHKGAAYDTYAKDMANLLQGDTGVFEPPVSRGASAIPQSVAPQRRLPTMATHPQARPPLLDTPSRDASPVPDSDDRGEGKYGVDDGDDQDAFETRGDTDEQTGDRSHADWDLAPQPLDTTVRIPCPECNLHYRSAADEPLDAEQYQHAYYDDSKWCCCDLDRSETGAHNKELGSQDYPEDDGDQGSQGDPEDQLDQERQTVQAVRVDQDQENQQDKVDQGLRFFGSHLHVRPPSSICVAGCDSHRNLKCAPDSTALLNRGQYDELRNMMRDQGCILFMHGIGESVLQAVRDAVGTPTTTHRRPYSINLGADGQSMSRAHAAVARFIHGVVGPQLAHTIKSIYGCDTRPSQVDTRLWVHPPGFSGVHGDYFPVPDHASAVLGPSVSPTRHHQSVCQQCATGITTEPGPIHVGPPCWEGIHRSMAKSCEGCFRSEGIPVRAFIPLDDDTHGQPAVRSDGNDFWRHIGTGRAGSVFLTGGRPYGAVVDTEHPEATRTLELTFRVPNSHAD
jgi:hypothetical protein